MGGESSDIAVEVEINDSKVDFDLESFFNSEVGNHNLEETASHDATAHPRARLFSDKLLEYWISRMRELVQNSDAKKSLKISEKSFTSLIEEIVVASQRLQLNKKLSYALNVAEANAGTTWETIVDRQVNISRNIIGEFIMEFGLSDVALSDRPGFPIENPKRRIFQPFENFELSKPPINEIPLNVPVITSIDWLTGLNNIIIENAGFVGKESLPADLNSELGNIIHAAESMTKS
jgi:hypothetical protein